MSFDAVVFYGMLFAGLLCIFTVAGIISDYVLPFVLDLLEDRRREKDFYTGRRSRFLRGEHR